MDTCEEILVTITRNKTRSLLTAFGVFWGIFMLVALIGSGQGMQEQMKAQFEGFATNSGFIAAQKTSEAYKGFRKGRWWDLEMEDVERVRSIDGIKTATPSFALWGQTAVYGENKYECSVKGLYPEYEQIEHQEMTYGRFINDVDIREARKVCVIGKRVYESLFKPGEDMLITILLLVILGTVLFGEFLGVNLVVGAFIAGLALSRLVKEHRGSNGPLMERFESIGYGLLIPFLFISIGMQTDFRAFGDAGNWLIILFTVIGLVGSKVFSGWLAMRVSGFSGTQGLCAGLMTVPQLSATLAAAAIGKDLGMIDNNFFNAIIHAAGADAGPVHHRQDEDEIHRRNRRSLSRAG